MDAFSIAAELLGHIELSSGQLGQLRALDYRLLLEVDRLAKSRPARPAAGGAAEPPPPSPAFEPTPEEEAALRASIIPDILEMLTPEQRAALDRR
jgi:hypothetical protein